MNNPKKFIFLISPSPKSGSTLVAQILNNHSKLQGAGFKENYVLSRMLNTLDWLPEELEMWDWVRKENPNLENKIQKFVIDMSDVNKEYCPIKFTNFSNFKWLRTVIPDCKIIFLSRDLKDTYCSCRIQLKNIGHEDVNPHWWFDKYIWECSKNIHRDINNVHFLTYEDFVRNTEDELSKIYTYLDWDYEFSLAGTRDIFQKRSLQVDSNNYEMLKDEITDKRIGRYNFELSKNEICQFSEFEALLTPLKTK